MRLDDPQSIHNVRRKAGVNIQRHIVGQSDDNGVLRAKPGWRGKPFHVYAAKQCNLGITLQVWDIGEVNRGQIIFFRKKDEKKRCAGSMTLVKLENHPQDTPPSVIQVYICNKKGDFERVGVIDDHHVFHYDLSLAASLIKSFFHLFPQQEDDEYSLNVVHNQREWFHRKQRACSIRCCDQPLFGLLWWLALILASFASIAVIIFHMEHLLLPFYVLEILSVAGLCMFGAVVGLVEEDVRVSPSTTILKMRDGKFTCYSGHTCMETKSASGWTDDVTQEQLEPDTAVYYCYRCDFVTLMK